MGGTLLAVALATVGVGGCGRKSNPAAAAASSMTAQEQANLRLALDWWREVLEARHLELSSKYQADGYIQHNINVPTGRQGFVDFFSPVFAKAGPPVTPIPAKMAHPPVIQVAKGQFVVLVWEHGYDMLRVENGKIQEHWDYAVKAQGTPRGGAPDGIDYDRVSFEESAQEQKNIEVAMTGFKGKPTLMFASGAYVFVMSKQALKDPDDPGETYPAYWFDLVRVENGLVREHWDPTTA
jgi:predicted SnoaL-like aldol condensation-catalyzing enzyme